MRILSYKYSIPDTPTYNFGTDTSNPVDVGLTIGDDTGTANVRLKGELMSEKK